MTVKVTTDLVSEPLSLTEAKANMRIVDFTTDDTLITSLIKSTRMHLEKFTGLSFGVKTIETTVIIDGEFELPYGPVLSVTSVEVKDDYATWTALTTANEEYELVNDTLKVYYPKGLFKVTYQAGYTSLPEDLKTDLKTLVAWQYQNRGIKISDSVGEFPNYLNAWKYRKVVI